MIIFFSILSADPWCANQTQLSSRAATERNDQHKPDNYYSLSKAQGSCPKHACLKWSARSNRQPEALEKQIIINIWAMWTEINDIHSLPLHLLRASALANTQSQLSTGFQIPCLKSKKSRRVKTSVFERVTAAKRPIFRVSLEDCSTWHFSCECLIASVAVNPEGIFTYCART